MDPMLNTPAMPILPDMPTRSRKLLEDLGSSPIASGGKQKPLIYSKNQYLDN